MTTRQRLATVLARKRGILLDLSLGGDPQPSSVTYRPRGGDLKGDPRLPRLPLPTASVHTAVITHVLEYVDPADWWAWWNELHRVMRPFGIAFLSGPYGGDESQGWLSDPTHRVRVIEETFSWLDPVTPIYAVHDQLSRPRPRPWKVLTMARVPAPNGCFSYNVQLQARRDAVTAIPGKAK